MPLRQSGLVGGRPSSSELRDEALELSASGRFVEAGGVFAQSWRAYDRERRLARKLSVDVDLADFRESERERKRRERVVKEAARQEELSRSVQIGFGDVPPCADHDGRGLVPIFMAWSGEFAARAEELFSKCIGPVRDDGCVPWLGPIDRKGVGVCSLGGPADVPGAVIAYRMFMPGGIPRGHVLKRLCESDCYCVEISHYELMIRPITWDPTKGRLF